MISRKIKAALFDILDNENGKEALNELYVLLDQKLADARLHWDSEGEISLTFKLTEKGEELETVLGSEED
jgi:hypothetical protein